MFIVPVQVSTTFFSLFFFFLLQAHSLRTVKKRDLLAGSIRLIEGLKSS